ncbi:hypothetical protein P5673_031107 [Acropora cervicornis]|uniref:Uncharacterized protein n=1 Tax=Acropora cervicornis TaxID=6130 RepID=A0AAD9PU41_ACRCE|nr:hypothetical protein P5673_031107 [Acropora cervicornis]
MSRLAILIFVLSIASVVFMQANAATTQKRSLSSNPEGKLMEELEEANDEEKMNEEEDPGRCKFYCRLGCRRICRGCRPKCKLRCSRGCYYGK